MNRTCLTHRIGVTIVEMLAASSIAGVLIALVAQLLVAAAAQQQAAGRRTLAMNELANVAERVAALTYDEVTSQRLANIELAPHVAASLSEAKLSFDMQDEAGPPAAKRITITLAWMDASGQAVKPLRLVTWKFALEEDRQ